MTLEDSEPDAIKERGSKLYVIATVALVFLCFVVGWATGVFGGRGSRIAFDEVELGMSLREVSERFGGRSPVHCDFGAPYPRLPGGEIRFRKTWYVSRYMFNVHFDAEGRVVGKDEFYSPSLFERWVGWGRGKMKALRW